MRAKVFGTASRPRFSVFRSNRYLYGQVINDETGTTIVGVHSAAVVSAVKSKNMPKSEAARAVGRDLARRALEKNVRRVTFDRGGYSYQGRVRSLAEGAREGGLEF